MNNYNFNQWFKIKHRNMFCNSKLIKVFCLIFIAGTAYADLTTIPPHATPKVHQQLDKTQTEIEGIVSKAQQAIKTNSLTTPVENNAVFYAKQILAKSPNDSRALHILNQVCNRYISLAYKRLNQYKINRAKRYHNIASKIATQFSLKFYSQKLVKLEQEITKNHNQMSELQSAQKKQIIVASEAQTNSKQPEKKQLITTKKPVVLAAETKTDQPIPHDLASKKPETTVTPIGKSKSHLDTEKKVTKQTSKPQLSTTEIKQPTTQKLTPIKPVTTVTPIGVNKSLPKAEKKVKIANITAKKTQEPTTVQTTTQTLVAPKKLETIAKLTSIAANTEQKVKKPSFSPESKPLLSTENKTKQNETQKLTQLKPETSDTTRKVLFDSYQRNRIVVIVNKQNEVQALTLDELQSIYKGTKKNWPNGEAITLYLPPPHSDELLWLTINIFHENSASAVNKYYKKALVKNLFTQIPATSTDGVSDVSRTKGSIAIVKVNKAEDKHDTVKIFPIKGVKLLL